MASDVPHNIARQRGLRVFEKVVEQDKIWVTFESVYFDGIYFHQILPTITRVYMPALYAASLSGHLQMASGTSGANAKEEALDELRAVKASNRWYGKFCSGSALCDVIEHRGCIAITMRRDKNVRPRQPM